MPRAEPVRPAIVSGATTQLSGSAIQRNGEDLYQLSIEPGKPPTHSLIDSTRDVSFVFVSGLGRVPGESFVLRWQHRTIPFETLTREKRETEGLTYYLTTFTSFGSSQTAEMVLGATPYSFDSPAEKVEAKRLAAEGLLVFGTNYNGLTRPDGYNRVELDGAEMRLSDFGIESDV